MQLNASFIANITDIYGETGKIWLDALPLQLKRLAAQWDMRFLKAMPNLTYNFVGLMKSIPNGKKAIIKISPAKPNIENEFQWFQCFTHAIPQIYAYDEKEHALVMEYVEPGQSLASLVKNGDDDSATRIICQTIRNLQNQQQKIFNFKHLSELQRDLKVLTGQIEKKYLSKAQELFAELTADRANDVILHGDLHHDNILASGSSWKVIDPHGYCGDPAFEAGAMIYNPWDSFPTDRAVSQIVARRIKILTEELPFDVQRIKAWTFCMSILTLAWSFADHAIIPKGDLEIAIAIDQIKI